MNVVMGIITMAIVLLLVFLVIATESAPFIGFGTVIAFILLFVGALVDVFGRDIADTVARVILSVALVTAIIMLVLELYVWGSAKYSHKAHVKIGQTQPDTVIDDTFDSDDDYYDASHLTSYYDPDH